MQTANTKLAKQRRANELSREKLCAMAQDNGHRLSYPALVQYERGVREPRTKLAIWLAGHFDTTVEDLFNDKRKNNGRKNRAKRS